MTKREWVVRALWDTLVLAVVVVVLVLGFFAYQGHVAMTIIQQSLAAQQAQQQMLQQQRQAVRPPQ